VNCLGVRELLPEFAVGVLPPRDRTEVERHLRWCAGCRKESADLGHAAATFAFALEPAPVPAGLDERVVEHVQRAAGVPRSPSRKLRMTAAALVAVSVAVGSLGWGAVMAGRADRYQARAEQAQRDRADALARFQHVLTQIIPGEAVPTNETRLGQLAPSADGVGGGFVLQLVSPTTIDFTMVIVNGLFPKAPDKLPYRVELFNGAGEMLRAGKIDELDADGGAEVFRQFDHADLSGYTSVRIVDATGAVVLTGRIGQS